MRTCKQPSHKVSCTRFLCDLGARTYTHQFHSAADRCRMCLAGQRGLCTADDLTIPWPQDSPHQHGRLCSADQQVLQVQQHLLCNGLFLHATASKGELPHALHRLPVISLNTHVSVSFSVCLKASAHLLLALHSSINSMVMKQCHNFRSQSNVTPPAHRPVSQLHRRKALMHGTCQDYGTSDWPPKYLI